MFKKSIILPIALLIVSALVLTGISCRKEEVEKPKEVPKEEPEEKPKEEAEEKEEWSTYHNSKFNFSIDYPKDWKMKESENKDMAVFEAPTLKEASPPDKPYPEAEYNAYASNLEASGSNEKGLQTLEEYVAWTKDLQTRSLEGLIKYTSEDSCTVNDKQGIKLTGEYSPAGRDEMEFVEFIYLSLDKVWKVHCEAVKNNFDDYTKIFDQVIDSLKIEE